MEPVDIPKEEFPMKDTMDGVVHHICKDVSHNDLGRKCSKGKVPSENI
jgi:hypothetical protein